MVMVDMTTVKIMMTLMTMMMMTVIMMMMITMMILQIEDILLDAHRYQNAIIIIIAQTGWHVYFHPLTRPDRRGHF